MNAVVVVDDVLEMHECAEVRVRLAASGWTPWELADRGRYEVNLTHEEPELVARLVALASEKLGLRMTVASWRWTRLRRGDYALFKDDNRRWRELTRHVELTADLSAAASEEGHIFYAFPNGGHAVPQRPGSVCVVDRRVPSARYERYLGVRFGDGEIVRLGLVLEVQA